MVDSYRQEMGEEEAYLEKTLQCLYNELAEKNGILSRQKERLIAARRDMWENTSHYSRDFSSRVEISQHLSELHNQTAGYGSTRKRIDQFTRMLGSPYFGRFDFAEEESKGPEKIYVGLHNLMDSQSGTIYVYDWRSPIAGIYYQYELGKALYHAPSGLISGRVLLKRQYKIKDGKLEYFFDCSVRITDEILQEVLCRNSSDKMRHIVETIQKEQDEIIRDTNHDLLIVQGIAGSGKTSVALHRIAFLLYHGLGTNLGVNNALIISPNAIFSKYISGVLPELGEDNVEQMTFDDMIQSFLDQKIKTESRFDQLEKLISSHKREEGKVRMESIAFKGSYEFMQILDRLIRYFERQMIEFEDIYFDGKIIETRHRLRTYFLNDRTGLPVAKRLERMENKILEKVRPLQQMRLKKIEKLVARTEGHELEIKSFSRLLSLKKSKVFFNRLRKVTGVNFSELYQTLFCRKGLFEQLTEGLDLPENLKKIIALTKTELDHDRLSYEDCAPLLYLKLRLEGVQAYSETREIVVDEAQDYDLVQYQIFKMLFPGARFTVLGDIRQAVDKEPDLSLYDHIVEILDKRKSLKLFLNKGYRSSAEINDFSRKILKDNLDLMSFDRREAEPKIIFEQTKEQLDYKVVEEINSFLGEGFESVAVICKTAQEAQSLYGRLKERVKIKLVNSNQEEIQKGALVIPSYLAKGLEFDVVFVYDTSNENYSSEMDRKLLYIACTRALHRLALFHTGEKSPLVP